MKKTHCLTNRDNAGMALLTALIFISITVLVLTSMMGRYVQQRIQTDRFEDQYACFEAAESAIQQGKAAINRGETGFRIGIPDNWEPEFDQNGSFSLPDFEDSAVTPATLTSNPDVEYIMYIHDWENDGRDTNGDGVVDSDDEEGMFSIHSAARFNNTQKSIEAVYDTRDFGIWNNAIFAGRGQAGRLINGNVKIHGSVHLLGDGLPEGALALDMGGAGWIMNDYAGIETELADRVPALKTTEFNGETVKTLDTELRVRNGIVAISGNSHVGLQDQSGNAGKETVLATYVNDGWGGNKGTVRVFSDNGTDEPYDLGNTVGFPLFEDNYRDKDTGEFVHNPSTGTWYTHAEYFTEVLTGGENRAGSGGTFHGDIVLDADIKSKCGFYWNATTGDYLTGNAANGASPAADDHYIWKKTTEPLMKINGCIHIDGDLTFTGKKDDFSYFGRGALMVEGDVTVDTHLLSCNGKINDYDASFPYTSCLGVMARGQIDLGTVSQRMIMGAFYSATNVTQSKQTQTMGTVVGEVFEMGNQVPDIFQVPVLADNLPLGMIGDYPIFRTQMASWREVGVN